MDVKLGMRGSNSRGPQFKTSTLSPPSLNPPGPPSPFYSFAFLVTCLSTSFLLGGFCTISLLVLLPHSKTTPALSGQPPRYLPTKVFTGDSSHATLSAGGGNLIEYDVLITIMDGLNTSFTSISDEQVNITAEMALPNSRVHVLTNNKNLLQQLRLLQAKIPWGDRLMIKDVRPMVPSVRTPFMQKYKHQSVNRREAQAFNFWRWGLYHQYLQDLKDQGFNVTRVWTLDADVIPTRPYTEWLPRPIDAMFGKETGWVSLVPGAVNLWTPQKLKSYWDFVQGLYATPDKTEWFVRTFGIKLRCEIAEVVPCDGEQMLHVGDMAAMEAYDKQPENQNIIKNAYPGDNIINGLATPAFFIENNYTCTGAQMAQNFLFDKWRLVARGNAGFWSRSHSSDGWDVMLPKMAMPACFIHFQGNSKMGMPKFELFVRARKNGSLLDLTWMPTV